MDSASNSSDGAGKQPASSILNVFNSFFSRDRSASSNAESAVLTSFKELADGENPFPEGGQTTCTENKLQGREGMLRGDMTASSDTRQRAEALEACKESGDQVKTAAGVLVDADLVQVTRVETYSDAENEDEEAARSSLSLSEKLARTMEHALPEEDGNKGDHGDGNELKDASEEEYLVPVFRTHKLKKKSHIEAILHSDRFISRTDSSAVLVSSVSKEGGNYSPKESTTNVSMDVETSGAAGDSNNKLGSNETDEYAAIDCSLPVPSVISGHLDLESAGNGAALVSPLKQTEDLDSTQKEETSRAEDPHSSQVSSCVPSSPPIQQNPEVSVQSSSSPEVLSDSAGIADQAISLSSAPKESPGDIQPSASPASQRTPAPKTPETSTPPRASSSASSPSRATSLSSPPSFQMPALFSGLRVLKKGAVGEDRETMSEIKQREKDADLALLSLKKTVNKAKLFPEQKITTPAKKHAEPKPVAETKSTVVGQLSQLLNLDNQDGSKKSDDGQDADPKTKKESEDREEVVGEKIPGPETPTSSAERKKTSDLAYETFRNIFGPKTVRKEKTEDVDLEAVKKKIKNDKENLRSIFERASKSPSKEVKSPTEANV